MSEAALSKEVSPFSFLADLGAKALNTPLEDALQEVNGFPKYTTGTLARSLPSATVEQCSALRTLQVTTSLLRLARTVAQIQRTFNNNQQPSAIVDPQVVVEFIDHVDCFDDITDDERERSALTVEYLGEVPSIQGMPIWDRLPGERQDFFNVFKIYRDSRYFLLDDGSQVVTSRTIGGLSQTLMIPGATMQYLSKLYAWDVRIAAYDSYMLRMQQRRQMQIANILQSDHLKIAQSLSKKAYSALNNCSNLQPKEAIQLLDLSYKLARLSIGLLPDKPGSSATAVGNQTNLAIYQNTTHNNADQMMNINAAGAPTENGGHVIQQLQEDMKQEDNILSILHVLQASGALTTAIHTNLKENGDAGLDIIDIEEES